MLPLPSELTARLEASPVSPVEAAVRVRALMRFLASPGDHSPQLDAWLREVLAPRVIDSPHQNTNDVGYDQVAARSRLARAVREHLPELLEAVEMDGAPPATDEAATAVMDGVLRHDELLAQHLERQGAQGTQFAAHLREKSIARIQMATMPETPPTDIWAAWYDERASIPITVLVFLAFVLWHDRVEPALLQEAANPPAVVLPVLDRLVQAHSQGALLNDSDGHVTLLGPNGEPLAEFEPNVGAPSLSVDTVEMLHRAGPRLLGSLDGQRLLRWEVQTGHEQVMSGCLDPRVLRVPGGWTGLTRAIGARGHKAVEQVQVLVMAQAHLVFTWPDGSRGNLIAYQVRPARRGRRAMLTITLGDQLLPGYVHRLSEVLGRTSRTGREARRLVPLTPLPPLIGRERDWGSQAAFSLLVVIELRRGARQLVEEGGVLIRHQRLAELSSLVALPRDLVVRVMDRWTHDGDDAPAFLESTGRHRYLLGSAHRAARDFLEAAGRSELEGAERGRKRGARRRKGGRR